MNLERQILEILEGRGPTGCSTDEICRKLNKTPQELGDVFEGLKQGGQALGFAGVWLTAASVEKMTLLWVETLAILHTKHSDQPLLPAEMVAGQLGLDWGRKPADRFAHLMAERKLVRLRAGRIALPDWQAEIKPNQRELLDRVKEVINAGGLEPLAEKDVARLLQIPVPAVRSMMELGLDCGELIEIASGQVYTHTFVGQLLETLRSQFDDRRFAVSEARDALETSRRLLIPILEYFDSAGWTRSEDGVRTFAT